MKENSSEKIDFQLASNLMIIPLEVNGVMLSFVLDTGVSKPILFNLSENDSLDLKATKTFYLHGLGGDGKLKAIKTSQNRLKLGDAVGFNQDMYVVFDSDINFTPRLGVLVHGLIGYDIFKGFVVEIKYSSKYIRLHKPNSFQPKSSKKWKTLPIHIHNKKSYLDAKVTIDTIETPVKLLIDTGSSDALWLFENEKMGLKPKSNLIFDDYLGKGLSGSIYGKRSKVNNFKLNVFDLIGANVAFPDSLSLDIAKVYRDRNGSIGGGILKRFNTFFDYTNKKLYIKKNKLFKEPFSYNNSGIVLEYNGNMFVKEEIKTKSPNTGYTDGDISVQISRSINFRMSLKPVYRIVEIRMSSNAYVSGLRKGDVLITINGKPAYNYKLFEINTILYDKTGKKIRMTIEREGEEKTFKFSLDNVFEKNKPSN
ncbi:retropepsin-like aspartic protease [Winogradskyella schleiferi]|uniref:retropepsin-like aspartic protease n=1 Tax=Winogradskyella schleiferi TaxID=2686078 RepID=UPI0015C0049F|nr:aspartyl protease family protein [Winogradskyella schleiferi]